MNESPQITCAEPLVIDCTPAEGASVTPEVTVTDSDDHQTLTVILKSGNTELDRQFVLAPANNAVVKFKPVLLAPGSHPLTVSVFDGFEQASCESSVTINADDSAPTFTTVPEDIVVTATSLNGAFVNFSDAIASDNCSVPTVVYSHNPETQFPIGTTTVICTATDLVGNESTESFTVTVGLPWSGVLQPINEDGSSVFKAGSTVPVKFRLTGVAAGVSDLHATLSFAKVSNLSVGTVNEAVSTANATSGNLFRFDPAAQQYIFNWSTKGLTAGTYQLLIDLGDGVEHTVIVGLR